MCIFCCSSMAVPGKLILCGLSFPQNGRGRQFEHQLRRMAGLFAVGAVEWHPRFAEILAAFNCEYQQVSFLPIHSLAHRQNIREISLPFAYTHYHQSVACNRCAPDTACRKKCIERRRSCAASRRNGFFSLLRQMRTDACRWKISAGARVCRHGFTGSNGKTDSVLTAARERNRLLRFKFNSNICHIHSCAAPNICLGLGLFPIGSAVCLLSCLPFSNTD